MNFDNGPASALYGLAAKTIAQVGCLLTIIAGGSVIVGVLIDKALGTEPAGLFIALLGSVPVSLFAIYRYTTHQAQKLRESESQKEDNI